MKTPKSSPSRRVLIFVPEFPRLTETFIQREISKLIELGNLDITVFSLERATGTLFDNVRDRVVYKRVSLFLILKALFHFIFNHPKRLWKAYTFFVKHPERNFLKKTYFFLKSCGYAYLFLLEEPDHIHANFMSWPSTMAMLISTLLDIPYSISAHAKDVMVEGEYIPSKVKTAKFISICNKFAYQSCIDQSGVENPENVLLQYHGIDFKKAFEIETTLEKPERFVLFNGGSRLVEKKGQRYLIEAAKILKDEGYDFEVHIAGPGPLYEELINQIEELNLEETVFIHGEGKGVPFEEVVSYLKVSDIVVQSNINLGSGDADGVPTFVIESALMGMPIVTTGAGSITDLIRHEDTGLVVSQKNPHELAEGIKRLIENPDLARELGEKARDRAEEMFDLEKNVKELEALLIESVKTAHS